VKNARKLEKELDSIRIGSLNMHVKLPRYRRGFEETRKEVDVKKTLDSMQQPRQRKMVKVWKIKGSRENHVYAESKAGRESNVGSKGTVWEGQSFNAETVKPKWLIESWIGTMVEFRTMEVLREDMLRAGMGSIRARYLGEKDVLLTGQDGILMKDCISANGKALTEFFEVLKPWNKNIMMGNKVVWMRCRGLPLHLWNMDCFKQVADNVGTLLDVDEATAQWERLEFARLKVIIPVSCKVKMTKHLQINGTVYCITLQEEFLEVDHEMSRRWVTEVSASESGSSMESRVAESLYSNDENRSWKGVSVPLVECRKTPHLQGGGVEELSVDAGQNGMDEVCSGGLLKREYGQCNPYVSETYAERCTNMGNMSVDVVQHLHVGCAEEAYIESTVAKSESKSDDYYFSVSGQQEIQGKHEVTVPKLLFSCDLCWVLGCEVEQNISSGRGGSGLKAQGEL